MSICSKHFSRFSKRFSRFLHNSKQINEYQRMEKAELGKYCLLLNCRWRLIYFYQDQKPKVSESDPDERPRCLIQLCNVTMVQFSFTHASIDKVVENIEYTWTQIIIWLWFALLNAHGWHQWLCSLATNTREKCLLARSTSCAIHYIIPFLKLSLDDTTVNKIFLTVMRHPTILQEKTNCSWRWGLYIHNKLLFSVAGVDLNLVFS